MIKSWLFFQKMCRKMLYKNYKNKTLLSSCDGFFHTQNEKKIRDITNKNVWKAFIFCICFGLRKWYYVDFFSKRFAVESSTKNISTNPDCTTKVFQTFLLSFCSFYVIFFLVLKFVFLIVFYIQEFFELSRFIYIVLDLCYPNM